MIDRSSSDWSYLSFALPPGADPEAVACLTQAAVDAGALGAVVEEERLLLYLPREGSAELAGEVARAVEDEAGLFGLGALAWEARTIANQLWATAWRKDFVALPIGRTLLVRPDWEKGDPTPPEWAERQSIWIRPGFGFGTGRHETTRLALEMLENHLDPGARVLDFGSGSGILSIAAIRLGASTVTAIEYDAEANENARENFELNGCAARIYLHEADRLDQASGVFDLIICNMLPHNALPHMETLAARLAGPESELIYSGFLTDQQREIEEALAEAGMVIQGFARMNEWGALVAERMHVKG